MNTKYFSAFFAVTGFLTCLLSFSAYSFTHIDLLGHAVKQLPYFVSARAFNLDEKIHLGINVSRYTGAHGTCDVYILPERKSWSSGERYSDWSLAPATSVEVRHLGMEKNIWDFTKIISETLSQNQILQKRTAAMDCDRNGLVSERDYIQIDAVSIYGNFSQNGSHIIDSAEFISDHGWLRHLIYFPQVSSGKLPLIVIAHGGGHQYNWYEFLQRHLASHGFIVISIDSHAMAGVEAVANELVSNIDHFLEKLPGIAQGKLKDKVDARRMAIIGHSRGGEGAVIAYNKLKRNILRPKSFSSQDIQLLAALAPPSFHNANVSNPHDVDFYMLVGAADGDVTQGPKPVHSSFTIFERAKGNRYLHYVYGLGHNVMNCCAGDEGSGPDRLTRPEAQDLLKAYLLALLRHSYQGDVNAIEYFKRPSQFFRPLGVSPKADILNEYGLSEESSFVLHDFENDSPAQKASSGALIENNLAEAKVGLMQDVDSSLLYDPNQPMNGFVRAQNPGDSSYGLALSWNQKSHYRLFIMPEHRNFALAKYITLRVAQRAFHPLVANSQAVFGLELEDWNGNLSRISSSAIADILPPYQRHSYDSVVSGWSPGFQTLQFPIDGFSNYNFGPLRGFDPTRIRSLSLRFGDHEMTTEGALVIDDIRLEGMSPQALAKLSGLTRK